MFVIVSAMYLSPPSVLIILMLVNTSFQELNVLRDGETNSTTLYVCKGESTVEFKWTYDDADTDKNFISKISWHVDPASSVTRIMEFDTGTTQLTVESPYTGRVARTTSAGANDIGMTLSDVQPADDGQYYVQIVVDKPLTSNDYTVAYKDQAINLDVFTGVDDTQPIPNLTLAYNFDGTTERITCSGVDSLGDTTLAIFDANGDLIASTTTTGIAVTKNLIDNTIGGTYTCESYYDPAGLKGPVQGACLANASSTNVPIHGGWGNWTDWTQCSELCDNGTQTRNRECDNPEPEYGGNNCTGSYEEMIECLEEYCSVDGSWGSWTEWDQCPVECGIRTRARSRVCNDPAPAYGGDNCPGSDSEGEDCTTPFCISSISPVYGPESGGTEISVRGSLGDSSTVDIKLYIGNLMCSVKSHEQNMAVFTNPAYVLHGEGAAKDQPIMIKIGDTLYRTWNNDFTYMVDPAVSYVKPGKCDTRAQTIQTATGSNLDSVAHPKMVVGITGTLTTVSEEQITNCAVFNSTTMTCPCPLLSNIRSKRDTFVPVTADVYTTTISFILDGITALEVADLTYYATVELGVFQSNYELSKDDNVISIKGTNLTYGVIVDDYTVKIGQYTCPDVQVTADEIQCTLSDDIIDDLQGKSAYVVVYVGDNIEFDVGLVEFPASDSPRISNLTLGAIIGGVISGLVLLALAIIFVALVKRSQRNQRLYLYNERNNYDVFPDPAQYKQPGRDVGLYHRERRSTNRRYRPRTKRFNRREYTQSRDPQHAHGRGHNTDSPYYSRGLAYTNSYRRNGPPDYDIYGSQDWAYY